MILAELTCPLPVNINNAKQYKQAKYAHLVDEARAKDWRVDLMTIEVSCMGSCIQGLEQVLSALNMESHTKSLEAECIEIMNRLLA